MNQLPDSLPDTMRVEGRTFRETLESLTRFFFAEVRQKTGSYRYRGILWHAFSYGLQNAIAGGEADQIFATCSDCELYLFDEQLDALWLCPRSIAACNRYLGKDVYMFPVDFQWLYITTHESGRGFGPYFARRSSVALECG